MTAHTFDRKAEHLLQLSNEVSRIAGTLARLSAQPGSAEPFPITAEPVGEAEVILQRVNAFIQTRRLREQFFPRELFADPAWDLLLCLFQAELRQQRIYVSDACLAAAVPASTALRWLTSLVDQGLFVRRSDPLDKRRAFIELSPEASSSIRRFFVAMPTI